MRNATGMVERCISLALAAVMALPLADCKGKANEGIWAEGGSTPVQTEAVGEKVINIGVTSSLNTLNPFLMDGVEMNKYATGLVFLPLMNLDKDINFEKMLADSITTENGSNLLAHIDDQTVQPDGTPVTTDDVIYTVLRICSPVIGSVAMMYYILEGAGDDGFVEAGVDHVEGITKVDDGTVRFTTKVPMSLITFKASYARYLMPLPKHMTGNISEENLMSDPWFNKPDVVSEPYRVTKFDRDHYVAYETNKDYWEGAPKIDRLDIKTAEEDQPHAGPRSGEIDVTQNTMSSIPLEDYESVQSLESVNVFFGDPITNQSVFIRTSNISDAKARQATLYAIDRRQILDQPLKSDGEMSEGLLSSAGPYFGEPITPVTYDPEKAKTSLEESGWDKNKTIKLCIDSGDGTFVNAISVIAARRAAVGIKADIQTMNIDIPPGDANKGGFDVMVVQYTYPPADPYAGVTWLLDGKNSWTECNSDKVDEALFKVQFSSDIGELKRLYSIIDKQIQENVPMSSTYITKTVAAVNKRLTGAESSIYGFLNHVGQWDIAQ